MKPLLLTSARKPWSVIVLLLVVTAIASTQLSALQYHISVEGMMLEDDPAKQHYEEARTTFGEDDGSILYLHDPDLLLPSKLEAVRGALEVIEELPFVSKTVSLFTVANLQNQDDEISTKPFLASIPQTEEARERLRVQALNNPMVSKILLSENGRSMLVAVHFKREATEQVGFDSEAVQAINAAIEPLKSEIDTVFQQGSAVVREAVSTEIRADQRRIIPLSLLLLLVLLATALKRINGALIPLATSLLSVIWTLGLMAALDVPINVMTSIVPALLVIVGSTEDVHMLATYFQARRDGLDGAAALTRTSNHISTAVALTFATTYLSFLSISLSPIQLLEEFGLVASTGLLFNFLITSSLVPAWLSLAEGKEKGRKGGADEQQDTLFQRATLAVFNFSITHKRRMVFFTIVMIGASIWGAMRIQVDNDPMKFFKSDAPLVQNMRTINQDMAGTQTFSILLNAHIVGTFQKLEYLDSILELQEFLEETGLFDKSLSFANVLVMINSVMDGLEEPDPTYLPEEDAVVEEYMTLISHRSVAGYITKDFSQTRIIVRHSISSSHQLGEALDLVQAYLDTKLPPGMNAHITG
ncbi:MAG: MMPL family transporter, partial [Magnetococcales bacterium]|nr:MMPL family transporter [Magnetococcales bacterium]